MKGKSKITGEEDYTYISHAEYFVQINHNIGSSEAK